MSTRNPVGAQELRELVGAVVTEWVEAGVKQLEDGTFDETAAIAAVLDASFQGPRVAFTAYNVTRALQAANPDKEIAHVQVRVVVPSVAALVDAMLEGKYVRLNNAPMPGGVTALLYMPNAPEPDPDPVADADEEDEGDASQGQAGTPVVIAADPNASGLIDNDPIQL